MIAGDIILREEPYAAVLEAIFRVNHCAHCLKKIPTPIPCYECATVSSLFYASRSEFVHPLGFPIWKSGKFSESHEFLVRPF